MSVSNLFEEENPLRILQPVIETAINRIILIDTAGSILMINAAILKLFGYEAVEFNMYKSNDIDHHMA